MVGLLILRYEASAAHPLWTAWLKTPGKVLERPTGLPSFLSRSGSACRLLSRSGDVGNLHSEGIRQGDLVILFLHQDVPDMFGHGIFA